MAANAGPLVAIAAGVYRNTSATYTTPTWVEIKLVRDVTPSQKWARGDASSRETAAKLQCKTQMVISGSMVARADAKDADYAALCQAAFAGSGSAPDMMILDGDVTTEGARGFRAHLNLDFVQNQDIGNVIYTTFDFDPTWNAGGWPSAAVVGATSTITYTPY